MRTLSITPPCYLSIYSKYTCSWPRVHYAILSRLRGHLNSLVLSFAALSWTRSVAETPQFASCSSWARSLASLCISISHRALANFKLSALDVYMHRLAPRSQELFTSWVNPGISKWPPMPLPFSKSVIRLMNHQMCSWNQTYKSCSLRLIV